MDAIVTQMIILFILVIIGYYLSKKKMMDADFDRKLSGLVINVTCPSLILSSVMGDTLPDKEKILPLLVVGFATYVILIGLAFLLPRYLPVKSSDRGIYSFMLAFGNVGFIGYPIVASIFGASAVFYASILNFPSTLLIFVFGTLFHTAWKCDCTCSITHYRLVNCACACPSYVWQYGYLHYVCSASDACSASNSVFIASM